MADTIGSSVFGEIFPQVMWIVIVIVALLVLIFLLPFILRKIYSRKKLCICGQKLNSNDTYCPKCGKKVEK